MVCPVCTNADAKVESHPTRDASVVDCPQCGKFTISREAVVNLRNESDSKRWKISAWIDEFPPPMVTPREVDLALASAVPSLQHRADRMLRWIATAFPPGTQFSMSDLGHWKAFENSPKSAIVIVGGEVIASRLMPIGWNRTIAEVEFMVTEVLCNEMGLLVSQS